ncbi:MAG: NTP transferase domain-containing protein [Myxococcaceae bacterium]|nr:NTP transferase domain-containing protein [Myxococcaceae bacterium]
MRKMGGLIAAAGRGSRSGLSYPKTLFLVDGKPILVRIIELMSPVVDSITVIVSPKGESAIKNCLTAQGLGADLVVQPRPQGMGDAVLKFLESTNYESTEDILLIWGDIPFIQSETINRLVQAHAQNCNDFTFVTQYVQSAYTLVERDAYGSVTGVIETREAGVLNPAQGERDIGLFLFSKEVVLSMLQKELSKKYGKITREHSFLYVVEHLVSNGFRVQSLPIAQDIELLSLNCIKDLERCAV